MLTPAWLKANPAGWACLLFALYEVLRCATEVLRCAIAGQLSPCCVQLSLCTDTLTRVT